MGYTKKISMADSGSVNVLGRYVASDNFMENMKFLDFPMESVEEAGVEEDEGDDWNEKLQTAFGPIPVDFLSVCLNENVGTNGDSGSMLTGASATVTNESAAEVVLSGSDTSNTSIDTRNDGRNGYKPVAPQPLSPISVLDSSNSRAVAKNSIIPFGTHIPKRARTKCVRTSIVTQRSFAMPPISSGRSNSKSTSNIAKNAMRRKIPEKKFTGAVASQKRCSHCQVTQTPQWREGPMGPKTLCNACGVRYRSGRLFPEYRPMASPEFVPSLHSNSHRKVMEMRSKSNTKLDTAKAKPSIPRVKKAPVDDRENSPPPVFIPMSSYLLDCVLGSEVFKY